MQSKWDKTPYTTLLYGTGGPNNYQFEIKNESVFRQDPSNQNTSSFDYSQQTGMVTDETTHSGSDVVVYATGDNILTAGAFSRNPIYYICRSNGPPIQQRP